MPLAHHIRSVGVEMRTEDRRGCPPILSTNTRTQADHTKSGPSSIIANYKEKVSLEVWDGI